MTPELLLAFAAVLTAIGATVGGGLKWVTHRMDRKAAERKVESDRKAEALRRDLAEREERHSRELQNILQLVTGTHEQVANTHSSNLREDLDEHAAIMRRIEAGQQRTAERLDRIEVRMDRDADRAVTELARVAAEKECEHKSLRQELAEVKVVVAGAIESAGKIDDRWDD